MNVFIGRIDHAPESKLASAFAREGVGEVGRAGVEGVGGGGEGGEKVVVVFGTQ